MGHLCVWQYSNWIKMLILKLSCAELWLRLLMLYQVKWILTTVLHAVQIDVSGFKILRLHSINIRENSLTRHDIFACSAPNSVHSCYIIQIYPLIIINAVEWTITVARIIMNQCLLFKKNRDKHVAPAMEASEWIVFLYHLLHCSSL